jgi:hypothetical protein
MKQERSKQMVSHGYQFWVIQYHWSSLGLEGEIYGLTGLDCQYLHSLDGGTLLGLQSVARCTHGL